MIGQVGDLFNASQGKFKKPDIFQPPASPYATAQAGRATYSPTMSETLKNAAYADALARQSGQTTDYMSSASVAGAKESPTKLFSTLLGNVQRAGGGLSGKGKYGGFNTAADLQSAIEGSATNFSQNTPLQLRSAANTLYSKLDPMRYNAMRESTGVTSAGFDPQRGGAAQFRMLESMPTEKMGQVIRTGYMNKLGEWYKQNADPAQEYLKTAQQIETTPMSQLATSIATRAYGMNPDLAAGKFAGLDASSWKQKRDQQYVTQYGVPYDEYQAQQKEATTLLKQQTTAATGNLETATGFSAKALAGVTGMTASQLSDQLGVQGVEFTDPSTKNVMSGSGLDILNQMKSYISSADTKSAQSIMDEIGGIPGAEGLHSLLKAYYHMAVIQPTKYEYNNAMYMGR